MTAKINFDDEKSVPVDEYEKLAKKFIPGYDALYALSELFLAEKLQAKSEILVVGSGGGKEITSFAKAFPDAHLTGVDPSEKMLAISEAKIQKENLQNRVRQICGTINSIEQKQFDAVTSLLVMHFLPDEEKGSFLNEIYQRLKPNGIFISADICVDKNDAAEFSKLAGLYKKHARINGVSKELTEEAAQMISEKIYAVSAEREAKLLRQNGFGEIRQFFQGLWFHAWIAVKTLG